jgi:hypothetical protein
MNLQKKNCTNARDDVLNGLMDVITGDGNTVAKLVILLPCRMELVP